MSGPKRSIKITDHFTCNSDNVICCITSFHCKKNFTLVKQVDVKVTDSENTFAKEMTRTYLNLSLDRLLPTFTSDLREKIRTRASFTNQTFNLCDIVNMFPCWPLCRCDFYNQQRQTRQCVVWASIRGSTRPKKPAPVLEFHPSGSQYD